MSYEEDDAEDLDGEEKDHEDGDGYEEDDDDVHGDEAEAKESKAGESQALEGFREDLRDIVTEPLPKEWDDEQKMWIIIAMPGQQIVKVIKEVWTEQQGTLSCLTRAVTVSGHPTSSI